MELAANRRDRRMLTRALYGDRGLGLDLVLSMLSGAVMLLLVFFVPNPPGFSDMWGKGLWIGAELAGLLGVRTLLRWRWRTQELVWLPRLPFDFDVGSYLPQLARQAGHRQAMVRARFVAQVPAGERAAICAAIAGASLDAERCEWAEHEPGELLIVVSQELDTSPQDRNLPLAPIFDNASVHAWGRKCIARPLMVVHARYPIASIDVSVD